MQTQDNPNPMTPTDEQPKQGRRKKRSFRSLKDDKPTVQLKDNPDYAAIIKAIQKGG